MKRVYEIGDEAWIYVGSHEGDKTKSTVVHRFDLYNKRYYVCEIPTSIHSLLEVRDHWSMAESEDSPIGLFDKKMLE